MPNQIDRVIAQQAQGMLANGMNCAQISGVLSVSSSWVYKLKVAMRRQEATCPVCKERWTLKGGRDPHRSVAEYIEMHGCSACLESGESAARGLM